MNIKKMVVSCVSTCAAALALGVSTARADVTLTQDESWLDGRVLSGTIDLAGHKLSVSSLTGDATITSSADAGYELLEYIANDGKAYVNTGVTVANDTVIDIKVQLLKDPNTSGYGSWGWAAYVGSRDGDSRTVSQFGGMFYGLNHYNGVSGDGVNVGAAALNADYLVHLDNAGPCTINGGAPFATGDGGGNNMPITVFALNQESGATFIGAFRVYSCRIAHGSSVQRDLKPARRLSDGALGLLDMKDTDNLVFYANANTTGAFAAGPVVSNAFAKPAELHVAVANGQTENATVAITGPVRVVKEGAGTFVAKKQNLTYTGGTDVSAGTFLCGNVGDAYVYGPAGSEVTVRKSATFDCDGWAGHHQHRFVLDGGSIKSAKDRGYGTNPWFGDVTLTKDSFLAGQNFGFVGGGWAESILRMNGHTLTLDVTVSRNIHAGNLRVEGGGEIYVRTGGSLALGGNPTGGKYIYAETTTLRVGAAAIYDAGGEHVFGAYVSGDSGGWDTPNTVIKVLNRFVPGKRWHATELQDGATLDLSTCEGAWNVTCDQKYSKKPTATATFAEGATIKLDLGVRVPVNGMKLIAWADADAPLQTVVFKLPDTISSDDFMLDWRSDGLLVMAAVKTATWTGAAGTADCTDPANWTCYDANDNVIDGARPGSITDVTVSGEVQLDIPKNSFSCASFTCDNVSLEGDCNWSGLGVPMNGSIDLAGHKLTVSSLTGDATITSSADAGYELLEYIANDGKAYVNTGVTVEPNTVIDIKVQLLKDPNTSGYGTWGWAAYVGSRDGDSRTIGQFGGMFYGLNHYNSVSGGGDNVGAAALNTDYLVHLDNAGSCTINGDVPFATGDGGGNNMPITVFALNQESGASCIGAFRVYSCRIAHGSNVQRDLKPARRLSDGALGLLDMKDAENPVFYANANTAGAFTAGPVASTEFAKPAELHVAVANGQTENATVAITGPVRVVKEGAGTFVATKKNQTYTGGTDVSAGTFRCGNVGDVYVYGPSGSEVTVREGATFDCDGWGRHHQHRFVLDGGTTKSAKDRGYKTNPWFGDVTLMKNSFLSGQDFGFVGGGWAESILRMNGHTLTLDVTVGGKIHAGNLRVEGGGEIYVRTGGSLALGGNPTGGKYIYAETTTLHMGTATIYDAGGEHVFGSYVSGNANSWDTANTVIKVLNRFKPGKGWHATELQNGATLDLSAYEGVWNVTCNLSHSTYSTATATFAEGATINVDLGDRKVGIGEKVISWTPDTAPAADVKFTSKLGKLRRMSDGAYYMVPFMVIIR